MPLITSTFFFYSVESLIAGVRKHRKTFKGFLFGNKFSNSNIRFAKIKESRGKINKSNTPTDRHRQNKYVRSQWYPSTLLDINYAFYPGQQAIPLRH